MPQQSTVILVDVQNIYYTARQAYQRNFDYNKFWAAATANRNIVKAIAYAIDRGDEKQKQFQNILRAIGFEVKLKPYIERSDGTAKGDWDVGITIDALEYGSEADVLVLATGDGDFAPLVTRLRERYETIVDVYGVPQLTAKALVDSATKFYGVEDELLL